MSRRLDVINLADPGQRPAPVMPSATTENRSHARSSACRPGGIRPMIMGAMAFSGLLSITAGLLSPGPLTVAALFFVACFGTVTLDALGNIPFLRSVHPYERSEMTSVFRTYIEMSQLVPQAIYAGLLMFLPIGSVFVALGALMVVTAGIAGYLPRRL